jgi:glucuronide carrier protein
MTAVAPSSLENAARPHLPPFRIAGYAAGDAGCNIAFQMTGLFLLVFYTNVVGIHPATAGSIFLFVKIWDAFADIFAGRMVDRTMTRWGKFRPFLLWYSIPLLASNILCFWIPVDGETAKIVWATASYALLGLLYSMVNIPYGSLAGAMSQNPVDRSRLASARMVGSGVTVLLLALVLAPQIKASPNLGQTFLITSIVFMVIGAVLFMITFLTAKETVYREVAKVSLKQTMQTVRQNSPLLRLCTSSFFYLTASNVLGVFAIYLAVDVLAQYVGGNWLATVITIITTGAVLYVAPFGPAVTRGLGKKRGFIISAMAAMVGCVIFFFSNSLFLALLGLFIIGAGTALLNTMVWAMESDTVEYGEYKTGIRTEGATYAAFSFTRKVGQAVGAALASYGLAWAGYNSGLKGTGQSQDPQVLDRMQQAAGFLTFAALLIAVLIMATYPLTEAKFRELMEKIQANRLARHAEYHPEDATGERSSEPEVGGAPGVRH